MGKKAKIRKRRKYLLEGKKSRKGKEGTRRIRENWERGHCGKRGRESGGCKGGGEGPEGDGEESREEEKGEDREEEEV